jgi:hypothetical protein
VHAARQSQNAHDVTRDERGVEDGVKRLAAALEREAVEGGIPLRVSFDEDG